MQYALITLYSSGKIIFHGSCTILYMHLWHCWLIATFIVSSSCCFTWRFNLLLLKICCSSACDFFRHVLVFTQLLIGFSHISWCLRIIYVRVNWSQLVIWVRLVLDWWDIFRLIGLILVILWEFSWLIHLCFFAIFTNLSWCRTYISSFLHSLCEFSNLRLYWWLVCTVIYGRLFLM